MILLDIGYHAVFKIFVVAQYTLACLAFFAEFVSAVTASLIRVVEGSADAAHAVTGVPCSALLALITGVVRLTAAAAYPFHYSSLIPMPSEPAGGICVYCFFQRNLIDYGPSIHFQG
jgi:hypothetical protein